jgi:GH35 family endo-1,4-beta-xylanase
LRWYDAFANGATGDECGSDYIYYSFRFARMYTNAYLYYNDFNEEGPAKREAIATMVEELNERWRNDPLYDGRLLIDRIGMQSHHHLDQWATNFDYIRPTIQRFIETGATLSVTELDVTIGGQGGNHPATLPAPLTHEQQVRLAEVYGRLFSYYLEFSDYIYRVSLWGKADDHSWRSWGHPLLFDGNHEAKEAFWAVIEATAN